MHESVTPGLAADTVTPPSGPCVVVDLSRPLYEGANGHRLHIRRGTFAYDGTYFHEMDIHSHLGSHVELPRNVSLENPDALELPLTSCIGWLEIVDVSDLPPLHRLTASDLEERGLARIHEGDIAGIFGAHLGDYTVPDSDRRVRLSLEAVEALIARGIKGIAMDNQTIALESSPSEGRAMHEAFLNRGLPIFENLDALRKLRVSRVFFMAFPLPIHDLDASPIRAVALVPQATEARGA